MKPDHKKPSIYPSQFIEDIIRFRDQHDKNPINLNIRKVQQAIDELKSMYEVHFEYLELANYAKRFKRQLIFIDEVEISLHPDGLKKIQEHLAWYNRMYESNEIINGHISKIWKKIK